MNKYNNNTSIRFQPEIKLWLYRRAQAENRSLGNLVNTILMMEMRKNPTNINSYTKEEKIAMDDRLYRSELDTQ